MARRVMAAHAIDGRTTVVGVIGQPVSHSRSPRMHNAAFAHLGLNWIYVPLPVAADQVGNAVRGLHALGLRGANVTVPHKQAVMAHVHELSAAATAIGAVNTIIVEPDGRLLGDNTDAAGFTADLAAHGVTLNGMRAIVLGAGGSARAIVYALAHAGILRIAIVNRNVERAQELVATLQPYAPAVQMDAYPVTHDRQALAQDANLIVNCTSQGMTPDTDAMPWPTDVAFTPQQVVYDLVYNPAQTRLLLKAQADGARAIGGIGMLLWQGALAFERWTGRLAPVEVMRDALKSEG